MHTKLAAVLLVSALFLVLAACADVGDAPEAETVAVDSTEMDVRVAFTGTPIVVTPDNSDIEWTASKVTRTHEGGFGTFAGKLYVDQEVISGVEIDIDAASIYSDEERLTGHLKSDDFFDVATWPQARFEATWFEPATDTSAAPGATHLVTGTLSMRDRTNQITFPATLGLTEDSVFVTADFVIDRQQWGLTYPGQPDDLIRDEVRLRLNVSAPRNDMVEVGEGDGDA